MLIVGCTGDDERAAPGVETVAPSTELTAEAFYQDYARLAGPDLLTRYAGGVLVTGVIAQVVDMGDPEGLEISLAVKGRPAGEGISLRFTDGGAQVRRRSSPVVGESITVRCRVGGKPAGVLFLLECALAP